MYITRETIEKIEKKFGRPERREVRFEMGAKEFEGLKASRKNGRNHDVTFFIRKQGKLVVIAKHSYPPGLYRVPSGGIKPGEDFIEGLKREAREETGCEIELRCYIMRIDVEFFHGSQTVRWVSHVFLTDCLAGDMVPLDTGEIRDARMAGTEEFPGFRAIMLASSSGGLHYRAYLHDEVLREIRVANLH